MNTVLRLSAAAAMVSAVLSASQSVIMTADPGGFSGVAENQYIKDAMTNLVNITTQLPFCVEAFSGSLYGAPALLVTTGIGHDHATMCMVNVLQAFHDPPNTTLKEVIYLGTSGWSPRPGGVLTAPGCTPQGPDTTLPGDVCVSAATTNWDCHMCTWNISAPPTVCQLPPCHGHFQDDVFGGCSFVGNTDLATEVVTSSKSAVLPPVDDVLGGFVGKYWDMMSTGTGLQYQVRHTPQVYDFRQCAEAGSYTFWSSLPYEMLCREYLSHIISTKILKHSTPQQMPVVCVAAMEAPGWMAVLLRAAQARNEAPIPFVNVRGASNYAHRPLTKVNNNWIEEMEWITPDEDLNLTIEGYRFAVRTSSEIVLSLYRQRK
eukprot:TRINITY_DN17336_c0_g1_i1.p1 TRINITY_DN17336_c0_g1~~TRINITY_DN17336_c0_g1_i1.p1  ORF type:complete len:400 (-),score=85.74 TRINITY_DN17336_c0_g1_i1:111-1232(-)